MGSGRNYRVIERLIKKVQDDKMVESGDFRDQVMLMSVCNTYKIEAP
jgi:hypothetical protein